MSPAPRDRKAMLAKVHIAKKALGMGDAEYRLLLMNTAGAASAADLDAAGLERVLARFRQLGWRAEGGKSPASRGKGCHTQADKIRALWIGLHRDGIVRSGTEASLNHHVKRRTGVDHVAWLSLAQASAVIEGLKKWRARVEKSRPKDAG